MMQPEIGRWLERAVADARFAWFARGLDLTIAVEVDGSRHGIRLSAAAPPRRARDLASPEIAISMTEAAWDAIAQRAPAPGYQSFGAWLRHDVGITVKGDLMHQAQALAALERLVELARPAEDPTEILSDEAAETVLGRRRRLTAEGSHATIHWLEAGDGPPVVFLHTAGADARQYRHQPILLGRPPSSKRSAAAR
jgi:hypothetical protein